MCVCVLGVCGGVDVCVGVCFNFVVVVIVVFLAKRTCSYLITEGIMLWELILV